MNRFFGMMPSSEISFSKVILLGPDMDPTSSLSRVTIDAGDKGWTIRYADSSTEYKDHSCTAQENFEEALATLRGHFPEAFVPEDPASLGIPVYHDVLLEECCDECLEECSLEDSFGCDRASV